MNREIKFRAWDKKYKKMHLGDIRTALAYPQEDIEIMQFVGLQDKNGKDIYEGDIVGGGHAVEWWNSYAEGSNPGWMAVIRKNGKVYSTSEIYGEIIGNIYEHSHLLLEPPE